MSIKATCNCGAEFKAKPELAGKPVKCPKCGQTFTVPKPQPATNRIQVTCQCGKTLQAKPELAGKRVKCPSCGQPLAIPDPKLGADPLVDPTWDAWDGLASPSNQEPETSTCPNCGTAMSSEVKVCSDCWYHTELGRTINPMGSNADLLYDTASFDRYFNLEAGVLTIRLGRLGQSVESSLLGLFGHLLGLLLGQPPIRVDAKGVSKGGLRISRQDLVDVYVEEGRRGSVIGDRVDDAIARAQVKYFVIVRIKHGLLKERTLVVVGDPNLANYIAQRIKQHIASIGRVGNSTADSVDGASTQALLGAKHHRSESQKSNKRRYILIGIGGGAVVVVLLFIVAVLALFRDRPRAPGEANSPLSNEKAIVVAGEMLTGSDCAAGDRFGSGVSVSGDSAVVGAPWHDSDFTEQGRPTSSIGLNVALAIGGRSESC